ncbi:MAG: hypothetical protein A3D24_04385 [Candidatus Blackburnbacteria bacterium RIFCSPHIGHO2_02_FULL_39_13]|uniref:Uncharacterized protein n=1 Tax=Candidatus Blackburnbacteria bacterium RIFCSPLOWO2_01_FULL_40_20 TaxID=1797519 RepID=A0A1G1VAX6_9BACT|nr:MAG: hypothetical protein A3D24_04385 [Candidatus Blackburnbacteria bacterium RIFCSPHIGHO2_02_FULL_39_13]OGY12506.1 MAG: hypothetical protein A3A77_00850 [Candidatus Blackburnbacteria bacterium RIFCSPLOWO2_01_FULL_40_20]OGY15806.1 MAG: hypothetical protein A3I52_03265 [Candidatus Blackburnbacteria bacterium RIFCSPLOWO2_02_FULL_40_10]HBL51984.1 hypothetical protein [Candidatus Blackburnbacteria bacterium]
MKISFERNKKKNKTRFKGEFFCCPEEVIKMLKERMSKEELIEAAVGLNAIHKANRSKQPVDLDAIKQGMDILANMSQEELDRLLKSLRNGSEK